MTTKKSERFHVIIVPRNGSRIRRFGISRCTFRVGLWLMGFSVVSLLAFGVYRSFNVSDAMFSPEPMVPASQIADLQLERAKLESKLTELETTLSRLSRFSQRLTNPSASEVGQGGPIASVPLRESGVLWKLPVFNATHAAYVLSKSDRLLTESKELETTLHQAFAAASQSALLWISLPTIWPTRGWITSEFGDLRNLHGGGRWHEGIDIASPRGSPVLASGDGLVMYVGYKGGYGKTVLIDHGNGLTTLYGHCSELFVTEGMRIKRGTMIGRVGNTGRSTGPHLHYEVHLDGVAVNPTYYIVQKG
ncbi:MAG: M23 family metallopeptidase [Deltaproteobacteria bacterium]|nr:M23 family metallopeptidase [Deltaproteobacteria bacterium]